MKKTLMALTAALLCALAFCEKAEVPVDIYDDGSAAAQEQKEDIKKNGEKKVSKIKWNTKANREAAMAGDPYNKKKMIGNRSFGDRLLNINKFTKMEAFSVYLKPTLGKLFVRKGSLIYREGTDVAGFEMYYDSSAYALQFAKAARGVAVNAINRYLDDFDQKRLDRDASAKKTREVYGFCEGYEDFGIISGMMMYYSRPKVFFGYIFDKHTPYFTINVRKAQNLAVNEKTEEGSLKANVIEQTYYFTKAQARRLATFLSDANIDALQASTTEPEFQDAADDYSDEPTASEPAQEEAPAKDAEAPKDEPAQKDEPAKQEQE